MVGSNLAALGVNKEEGIVMFTQHFYVCLITGLGIIDRIFIGEIKLMAAIGSRLSIIKHGLIIGGHREHMF